jgi:hypothetical protein
MTHFKSPDSTDTETAPDDDFMEIECFTVRLAVYSVSRLNWKAGSLNSRGFTDVDRKLPGEKDQEYDRYRLLLPPPQTVV